MWLLLWPASSGASGDRLSACMRPSKTGSAGRSTRRRAWHRTPGSGSSVPAVGLGYGGASSNHSIATEHGTKPARPATEVPDRLVVAILRDGFAVIRKKGDTLGENADSVAAAPKRLRPSW